MSPQSKARDPTTACAAQALLARSSALSGSSLFRRHVHEPATIRASWSSSRGRGCAPSSFVGGGLLCWALSRLRNARPAASPGSSPPIASRVRLRARGEACGARFSGLSKVTRTSPLVFACRAFTRSLFVDTAAPSTSTTVQCTTPYRAALIARLSGSFTRRTFRASSTEMPSEAPAGKRMSWRRRASAIL